MRFKKKFRLEQEIRKESNDGTQSKINEADGSVKINGRKSVICRVEAYDVCNGYEKKIVIFHGSKSLIVSPF